MKLVLLGAKLQILSVSETLVDTLVQNKKYSIWLSLWTFISGSICVNEVDLLNVILGGHNSSRVYQAIDSKRILILPVLIPHFTYPVKHLFG